MVQIPAQTGGIFLILGSFGLSTKGFYTIMLCPLCVVVIIVISVIIGISIGICISVGTTVCAHLS